MMKKFAAVCAAPLLFATTIWAGDRITGQQGEVIRMAMEKHVEEMIKMNGNGKYPVFDPELHQLVQLKLIHFHKGVEAKRGGASYFLAHADFMAEDGMVYDLDFVISKGYAVIAILVHAKDGVEAPYDKHHPER
jgi:hypothetical protein